MKTYCQFEFYPLHLSNTKREKTPKILGKNRKFKKKLKISVLRAMKDLLIITK